jgi:hypothetical protein
MRMSAISAGAMQCGVQQRSLLGSPTAHPEYASIGHEMAHWHTTSQWHQLPTKVRTIVSLET